MSRRPTPTFVNRQVKEGITGEFPFEYKRIYNAINYDLIERMNYIKEELEEQIEKAKRAQNYIKGQD